MLASRSVDCCKPMLLVTASSKYRLPVSSPTVFARFGPGGSKLAFHTLYRGIPQLHHASVEKL